MNHESTLSNNTKDYLEVYYSILDNMIEGMTNVTLTDSISHNFIIQMIPHHRAAIQMSENLLKYTTNIPLQNIASGIITAQTQSIAAMQKVQPYCSRITNLERDLSLYQRRADQIMRTMFDRMLNARVSNDINSNFIHEMLPHHMDAVEMSKNALQYNLCVDLIPILDAIISSQERGIKQMQQVLRQIGSY